MLTIYELLNQPLADIKRIQLFTLLSEYYLAEEQQIVQQLLNYIQPNYNTKEAITKKTEQLISQVRENAKHKPLLSLDTNGLLQQYNLNTQEGIVLMCLAEALLRIPDKKTADALIKDKLQGAKWESYLKQSDSFLVNASTYGLLLTGKVINLSNLENTKTQHLINRMVKGIGEPMIRKAMYTAMEIMGKQFVLGRNIKEALKTSIEDREKGFTHSFDMLGEAAITATDAKRYFDAYMQAIKTVGQGVVKEKIPENKRPSISIKLSALHPRFDATKTALLLSELYARVIELMTQAKIMNIGLTIDAEEMDRLELTLILFEKLYLHPICRGWNSFGVVVQAYSKRALPVLVWLANLAQEQGDTIPVRLVKGAYWDSEIKYSQELGLTDYPVYTRKINTDISYLACTQYLLSAEVEDLLYPQFATHNAQTLVTIQYLAHDRPYELQRLHGMGESLYDAAQLDNQPVTYRIYAPVGAHKDLLPYLVRRLLENGANSSFVNQILDPKTAITELAVHPIDSVAPFITCFANPQIPLPTEILAPRRNSVGFNLMIQSQRVALLSKIKPFLEKTWTAHPIVEGKDIFTSEQQEVLSPTNKQKVGINTWATAELINTAITHLQTHQNTWRTTSVYQRAEIMKQYADLLEVHQYELMALCVLEAGKILNDAIDEIREAVDFCRYYAEEAIRLMGTDTLLPGPTGESNILRLQGKGIFVCISPWNFPLAIFIGQICAALVTGNSVIAKPAEQTTLIAYRAVELWFEAGLPREVLAFTPGLGQVIGPVLIQHPAITGVCFTGSTKTAQQINQNLSQRQGAIATLIAETGGQNMMIVDSTALLEQVVQDVIQSAFQSAGQRCSACRVLIVQEDIAKELLVLLEGAMQELLIEDPKDYTTDIGPVIDATAYNKLLTYIADFKKQQRVYAQSPLSESVNQGYFVAPTVIRIHSLAELRDEQFGPILHVLSFRPHELTQIIQQINELGYGLTLGIHSRNQSFTHEIAAQINVGNIYINRNQIGARVGVQPFGGMGLSGTGPKAGGPHYLPRFITEKTMTENLTAIGGNTTLLTLSETRRLT